MTDRPIRQAGVARNSVICLYRENITNYHSAVRSRGLDIPHPETTFYDMTEFRLTGPNGKPI